MRKIVVFGELVGEKKRVVFGELGRVDRVGVPCRAREARPLVGYARPLFGQTESGPSTTYSSADVVQGREGAFKCACAR